MDFVYEWTECEHYGSTHCQSIYEYLITLGHLLRTNRLRAYNL